MPHLQICTPLKYCCFTVMSFHVLKTPRVELIKVKRLDGLERQKMTAAKPQLSDTGMNATIKVAAYMCRVCLRRKREDHVG